MGQRSLVLAVTVWALGGCYEARDRVGPGGEGEWPDGDGEDGSTDPPVTERDSGVPLPEGCTLRDSTPTAIEVPDPQACTREPVTVFVSHEATGCGCNHEYSVSWSQREFRLELRTEVIHCVEDCNGGDCVDRFRGEAILLFITPGSYRLTAGTESASVEIDDCSD